MKAKFFMGGVLSLLLAVTACSLDEVVQTSVDDNAISFKAVAAHATRAEATTTANLDNFTVWGWTEDGVFMNHVTAELSDGVYVTNPLYFWPEKAVDFVALSPSATGVAADSDGTTVYIGGDLNETDGDVTYTGHVAEATIDPKNKVEKLTVTVPASHEDQIDLCYAVELGRESGGAVALNFRHAMSQVVFKARNTNAEAMTIDVTGVRVCSVYKTGEYALPAVSTSYNLDDDYGTTEDIEGTQGKWTVGTAYATTMFSAGLGLDEGEYVTVGGEASDLTAEGGSLFLIPQKVDAWDVDKDHHLTGFGSYFRIRCRASENGVRIWPTDEEMDANDGDEFAEIAVPVDIDWQEGYKYTYTFVFGDGLGYYPPDDPNDPEEGGTGATPVLLPITFTVTVDAFQSAEEVERSTKTDEEPEPGDGTSPTSAYSVTEALAVIAASENTEEKVYVSGVISQISEVVPLDSATSGTAIYYISDSGETTEGEQLEVYCGLSLGGQSFSSENEIQVGDEVIVYGVLATDENEQPQFTDSEIYSLNGNTYEEPEEEEPEEEGELVYGNDFDAEVVAGNTDIKDGETCYQNEEGSGIATVTYGYSGTMSVRVSSGSSGYTDASGNNNIFFGNSTNEYFIIKDITLPTGETNFNLAFGALENASFSHDTFKVYVSEDKLSWVEVSYEFENGDPSGNSWGLASTTFTVPSGTEMLSIYYKSTKTSSYRIDDVRFTVASETGTAIDFNTGVELDGGDQEPEVYEFVGDGTLDNPYTASDAIALIAEDSSYDKSVYITGIVSQIGELYSSYNELSYYLSDDGTTDNQLYVYEGYGLNGEKIYSADYLTLGDELVIYGELKSYNGSAEVNYGSKIISINGETSVEEGDIVDATAAEVNSGADGTTYRVAGYITSVASTTYGNFYLKDYTGETYIYGTLDADGNTRNWESLGISAGDIVKVHGPKSTYGSTAELTDVTVDEHYAVIDVTIAEFNEASVSTEVYYRLTGTVTSIASTTYGNLYLEDDTGSVYVYGLPCGYGGSDNTFSSTGVAQGDVITIVGTRGVYGSTIEVVNGFYVETVSSGSTGGDTSDLPTFTSNVSWTLGDSASSDKAVINGTEYDVLKLGTGSKTGNATFTIPEGSTSLAFYCFGWNGKTNVPYTVTIGDDSHSLTAQGNSGFNNNSPYTVTVSDASDYQTITFDSALTSDTTVTVATTSSSNGRVVFAGINYYTD